MIVVKPFVRVLFLALILLAFPAGYVVQASDGKAAVKAFFADPKSFFSARSPGERGAVPFATTKPALAKLDPAISKPDPGIVPPDTEAFLEPPGKIPDVPANTQPFLEDPSDFGLAGPSGSFPAPDENALARNGFVPVGGAPPISGLPPMGGLPPIFAPPPIPQSTVPEPDTWLMMIVGFLAAGCALRLRKDDRQQGLTK